MIQSKSILLVEDSLRDAEMTLAALAEHNLMNQVVHTIDGSAALDYLYAKGDFAGRSPGNPLLVLLDLKMPRIDGIEVLRRIKRDPALRKIPVVMLTSSAEEQDLIATYDLGVNAYVVKPVDFLQFVAAIQKLGAFWTVNNEPPPGSVRLAP